MPQNPADVTNPGLVNVADQGDGPLTVDQSVTTSPSSNAGSLVDAADQGDGPLTVDQAVTTSPSSNAGPLVDAADQGDGPLTIDQPVTVGPPQVALLDVNAGGGSPASSRTDDVISNTVVGQVYGQGTPVEVFV